MSLMVIKSTFIKVVIRQWNNNTENWKPIKIVFWNIFKYLRTQYFFSSNSFVQNI